MQFSDYAVRLIRKIEKTLFRYGVWIVLLVAIVYYGSYYRCGLPLAGEGGTVAVIAMRLMEGQRPLADTFLGYNLMWFYPVVWLFQLTGPNYTALAIFFFSLCAITGMLTFLVVRKISKTGWFAFLTALGPVLIPGMMFRNYMGFLAVLNMLCLLQAYVFEQPGRWRQLVWMALAGIAVGITYLCRIDLGAFFTLILLGLAVLYCFGKRGEGGSRFRLAAAGLVLTALLFVATHAPFYLDAVRRGYAREFVAQYSGWIGMVRYLASQQIAKSSPPPVSRAATKIRRLPIRRLPIRRLPIRRLPIRRLPIRRLPRHPMKLLIQEKKSRPVILAPGTICKGRR